jgi:hypothetical protein
VPAKMRKRPVFCCPTCSPTHTHTHTHAAQQSLISYVKTFEEQGKGGTEES